MDILCVAVPLAILIMLLILGGVVVKQINRAARDEDAMNGEQNEKIPTTKHL